MGHKKVKQERYTAINEYLHQIVWSKDVVDAWHGGVREVLVHDRVKII